VLRRGPKQLWSERQERGTRQRSIRLLTKQESLDVSLLGSFKNTGNYAFVAHGTSPRDIASVVSRALQTPGKPAPKCAVIAAARVRQHLDDSLAWPKAPEGKHPRCKWGFRWTPGIAFLVEGPTSWRSLLQATDRARLRRLSRDAVAVHKRDCLRQDRIALDRTSKGRLGGWGRVSVDIERSIGGVWTARSHSTLSGLLQLVFD
jgi:hypothetical protein